MTCHKTNPHEKTSSGNRAEVEVAPDDCVGCHMPKHRAQDVVQVIMTDHLIQHQPDTSALLAPLQEHDPQITDVLFLDPDHAPTGDLGKIYRAIIVLLPTGGRHTAALQVAYT